MAALSSTLLRTGGLFSLSQQALAHFNPLRITSINLALPTAAISIPSLLSDIWEGILKAVPKKKTSHMKRRHRLLAGKALKDVKSVVKCPGCGKPKKAHTLCPYCVSGSLAWERRGKLVAETQAVDVAAWDTTERAGPRINSTLYNLLRFTRAQPPTTHLSHSFKPFVSEFVAESRWQVPSKSPSRNHSGVSLTYSQSKQYLALHSIDNAHPTDIFALATTPQSVISASGASTITIHSTSSDDFPIVQVLNDAHKLGCHHLASNAAGTRLVSVGFGGEVKIWDYAESRWTQTGTILDGTQKSKAGEVWAPALSVDGKYLAATTGDGRINVWDIVDPKEPRRWTEYSSKGSFGMCIDLSADGRFVASGHDSGNVYVFSTAGTGRMLHSLPGLVKPVRALKFSPGSKLLAAAGDALVISLYDPNSGEQVANLSGHGGWITSLDWNATGQYLLSGGLDGKVKVWDVEARKCVATHSESEKGLWSVKWLPKGETSVDRGKAERFVTAGAARSVAVYREATGG